MVKQYQKQTQTRLLHQLANGDEGAFSRLYRMYFNRLLQYGVLIHPNKEEVEDVVQDFFTWLAQNHSKARSIRNFEVYAFQALKRNLNTYRGRRHKKRESQDRFLSQATTPRMEPSFEQGLIEAESNQLQLQQLREALRVLPPYQQEVIYLRYYEGLDYEEISDIMLVRVQVARNYANRALKRLREQVSGLGKILHVWAGYLLTAAALS